MSLIFGQALFGWPRQLRVFLSALSTSTAIIPSLGMILTQPSQLTANMYYYIIVGGGCFWPVYLLLAFGSNESLNTGGKKALVLVGCLFEISNISVLRDL